MFEQAARRLRSVPASFLNLRGDGVDLDAIDATFPRAGRREAEFDAFCSGLCGVKVDNPVLRPASRTPSTRRRRGRSPRG